MTRTIKLAVAAAVALTSTAAFATNGDSLIGMGAKARGMGGIGIGMSHGAESGIANPAMIGTVKGTEVSFGATVFMPDVETDMGTGGGSIKSDADLSMIPEVAIAQNVGNGLTWGIGMYGVAGMGTDYSSRMNSTLKANAVTAGNNTLAACMSGGCGPVTPQQAGQMAGGAAMMELADGNFGMKTTLQLMQFALPLAYTNSGFTIAVAPVVQYGSLDIDYTKVGFAQVGAGGAFYAEQGSTTGQAQDLGLGYSVGVAFSEEGLTLGAVYKSAINMTYDGVMSKAASDFQLPAQGININDDLEQPAEYGVGASYAMQGHTIALDYKRVNWASANGYKDFGWQDQDVYAVGYQYAQDDWAVRLGYNYAESAVENNSNATINTFNLLGFPATVQSHYTVGGSYAFNKTTSFDLAYIYAEADDESYNNMFTQPGMTVKTTTKHTQDAVSAQLNFNF